MKNILIVLLLSVACSAVFARDCKTDPVVLEKKISAVRSLLPLDHDIAKIQVHLLQGLSLSQAYCEVENNFEFKDYDKNGIVDLAVVAEENPQFYYKDTKDICSHSSEGRPCYAYPGFRKVLVFMNHDSAPIQSNNQFIIQSRPGTIEKYVDNFTQVYIAKSDDNDGRLAILNGFSKTYEFEFVNNQFYHDIFKEVGFNPWNGFSYFLTIEYKLGSWKMTRRHASSEPEEVIEKGQFQTKPLVELRDILRRK